MSNKPKIKNKKKDKKVKKKRSIVSRGVHRALRPFANRIRRLRIVRKRVLPWLLNEEIPDTKSNWEIQPVEKDIARIGKSGKLLVVGPWLSEVGFEVLYWIPFLQWFQGRFGVPRERMVIVSRGGAEPWYWQLCGRYVDIFDFYTETEFKARNDDRIAEAGGQKHLEISAFDKEIFEHVKKGLGTSDYLWLHPSLMYTLFKLYWARKAPVGLIDAHTRYTFQREPDAEAIRSRLPKSYVAVKLYFSSCLPDCQSNRDFAANLLRTLTRETEVVLLSTGLKLDDHLDFDGIVQDRVHELKDLIQPRTNLTLQTQVLSGASAFIGTYGGFSYLAPFMGIPTVAFYSHEDRFLPVHLEVAYRACRSLKFGFPDKVKAPKGKSLIPVSTTRRAEFVAMNTANIDLMRLVAGGAPLGVLAGLGTSPDEEAMPQNAVLDPPAGGH